MDIYIPGRTGGSEVELRHYGVLGMKWGIRKDRGSKGWFRKKGGQTEADMKKRRALNEKEREERYINMYKNRDRMSTKQIREATARLQAEAAFEKAAYAKANERALAAAAKKSKAAKRNRMVAAVALGVASELPLENIKVNTNGDTMKPADAKVLKSALKGASKLILEIDKKSDN